MKLVTIANIQTNPKEFQFRDEPVHEVDVAWLVTNWDDNQCDPIDLWEHNGALLLICGHHRTEAALRLGKTELLARVHAGTFEAAKDIAAANNTTRKSYTDWELVGCFEYFINERGCTLEEACRRMKRNHIPTARKLYSLRHLRGTDWEVNYVSQNLWTMGTIVGGHCEKYPLNKHEIQSLFQSMVKYDLTPTQMQRLLKQMVIATEEATEMGLFDIKQFTTATVKAVRQVDALSEVARSARALQRAIDKAELGKIDSQIYSKTKSNLDKLLQLAS